MNNKVGNTLQNTSPGKKKHTIKTHALLTFSMAAQQERNPPRLARCCRHRLQCSPGPDHYRGAGRFRPSARQQQSNQACGGLPPAPSHFQRDAKQGHGGRSAGSRESGGREDSGMAAIQEGTKNAFRPPSFLIELEGIPIKAPSQQKRPKTSS